ncbi:MAG: BamA/TamA family outer membrane protein [Bacteroidota bacterium]
MNNTKAKKQSFIGCFLICYLLLGLTACQPTKYVSEGGYLYTGATINFEKPDSIKNIKQLRTRLNGFARPKTNNAIQLWFYNTFHNPEKEKGIGNKIADLVGQAPILYNPADLNRSDAIMEAYLRDNGYFNSTVSTDTLIDGKTLQAEYNIYSNGQYNIRNIYFPQDSSKLDSFIIAQRKQSIIRPNTPYQVNKLEAERARLTQIARNRGYFLFDPSYIFYFVDTTAGQKQADIHMRLTQTEDLSIYYMDTSYVYPTFNLDEQRSSSTDTLRYQDIKLIQQGEFVHAPVLKRVIAQDRGEAFKQNLQDQTVNHLLDLGIFKFVNVEYEPFMKNDSNFLRRRIYLTPSLTQDVNGEVELSTETSNFLGAAVSGSYTHRNIFHGAERLNLRLTVGVETQTADSDLPFVNTLELLAQANLYLPRFLLPFRKEKVFTYYIPRTRFSLTNSYQRRTSFFTLNSFQFDFGYEWQTTRYRRHAFRPLNVNIVRLFDITNDFQRVLDNNSRLRQSFDDIAILGMSYRFTYNDQEINTLKDFLFFQIGAETSGNFVSLLGNENNELFNTQFSQYIRFDLDTRYNFLNEKNSLITRLLAGVGIPYNNSRVMPYIKQYFVGGANSIRAFPLRGVGPGSVPPDITTIGTAFFDQTGDIRLEANIEYRFDLFPFVEGAAFVDAGNVWFLRNQDGDERFAEAEFEFNKFYEQLAVGTGLGIRLDLEFLLLRLDIAFPLRRADRLPGNRWVLDEINIGSADWRQNNLNYNLAIGYPF